MTAADILKELKTSNEKGVEAFTRELAKIRAGKANASVLDSVRVNYYGQVSPVNQVGSVSTPDARTIVISPWDATVLPELEKAIIHANLGFHPQNDGKIIRISIPALTEERRKELVKVVGKQAEDARVAARQARKVANEKIKGLEKEKKLSEDESKRQQETIQKETDELIKKIDQILAKKTDEIMTI